MRAHLELANTIFAAFLGSRGIPARYGGFETLVETLAINLRKDRFRITIFCERSLKKFHLSIPGVNLLYFPVIESFRLASEVFYDIVTLVWAAFAPVDVVLLFGYTASIFCLLPRLFRKPVLVNVDGLEWKRTKFPRPIQSFLRLAELIVTKTASSIICDSRAIQAYYRHKYRVDSEYVPNPVSIVEDLRPNPPEKLRLEPRSYYLVVARLEPENHIEMIIQGFLESKTTRRLVIVGPPANTRYVKHLLEMRTPHVLFMGEYTIGRCLLACALEVSHIFTVTKLVAPTPVYLNQWPAVAQSSHLMSHSTEK